MGRPWKGNGKSYNCSAFDTEISRRNCIWYRVIKYISVYDTGHFYIQRHPTLQCAHCAVLRCRENRPELELLQPLPSHLLNLSPACCCYYQLSTINYCHYQLQPNVLPDYITACCSGWPVSLNLIVAWSYKLRSKMWGQARIAWCMVRWPGRRRVLGGRYCMIW